jgi:hypothetical protein
MTHDQDNSRGDEMNEHLELPPEELFDLLSDRALFGLDGVESERLEELLSTHAWVRGDCMDDAVAQMAVAFDSAADADSMPSQVADRVSQAVHAEIAADAIPAPDIAGSISPSTDSTPAGTLGWLGWVAAAAAIAVAVMAWQPLTPTIQNSSQLVSWVDQHPDAVRWDWAPGLVDPAEGVTGYVTFSPDSQEGYMLIKGLEPNDPRIEQYQLWIWDQDREPDPSNPQPLAENVHPVDGGVFDVNDKGEVVIPIKLPLRVDQPYLFAVTVERPGGVVKSDKGSVPIIAGPPAADA